VFPFGAIEQEFLQFYSLGRAIFIAQMWRAKRNQRYIALIEVPSQRILKDDTHVALQHIDYEARYGRCKWCINGNDDERALLVSILSKLEPYAYCVGAKML
jgi:hypothetical protein